jgi:hypothetical protein
MKNYMSAGWIDLTRDKVQRQTPVNTVMNFRVTKAAIFWLVAE